MLKCVCVCVYVCVCMWYTYSDAYTSHVHMFLCVWKTELTCIYVTMLCVYVLWYAQIHIWLCSCVWMPELSSSITAQIFLLCSSPKGSASLTGVLQRFWEILEMLMFVAMHFNYWSSSQFLSHYFQTQHDVWLLVLDDGNYTPSLTILRMVSITQIQLQIQVEPDFT